MNNSYICSGCGKDILQLNIKAHIKNCEKYDSFYLRKIKTLSASDNINDIKVTILPFSFYFSS